MAYKKEYFSKEVTDLVRPTTNMIRGRYDSKVKLRLSDKNLVVRNLKTPDLVAKETSSDIIHKVTLDEDQRPDLIANTFYGDARLYWVILGANNLREKSQLTKGMIIRIPAKNSIYGNKGLLLR